MRLVPSAFALALAVLVTDVRFAQSQAVNVDFGDAESAPATTYAGVGNAGTWNTIGVLPPGQRASLVGLDGAPIAMRIYGVGGSAMLVHDDAATSGDDAALLDDMLIGFNNPLDVCIWFEAMTEGEYEVITYALTPGTASLQSRVRVDDATPGPIMVGGAFGGSHVEGVTYARHVVQTIDGKIGLHSGLYGGLIQSGMNGIQLRPVPPVGVGDPGFLGARIGVRSAQPNPARAAQRLEVVVPAGEGNAGPELQVIDARGRIVHRRAIETGTQWVEWDGSDPGGRAVPAGLYFARVVSGAGGGIVGATAKLVRIP
jgi:hypothetical protein